MQETFNLFLSTFWEFSQVSGSTRLSHFTFSKWSSGQSISIDMISTFAVLDFKIKRVYYRYPSSEHALCTFKSFLTTQGMRELYAKENDYPRENVEIVLTSLKRPTILYG